MVFFLQCFNYQVGMGIRRVYPDPQRGRGWRKKSIPVEDEDKETVYLYPPHPVAMSKHPQSQPQPTPITFPKPQESAYEILATSQSEPASPSKEQEFDVEILETPTLKLAPSLALPPQTS